MKKLVEDDTEPVEIILERAPSVGATPVPFDATGLTVAMVIKAKDGTVVATGGKVAWSAQLTSTLVFNRVAGDLTKAKSPYYAHVVVTDGLGKTASWPEGAGEQWVIAKRGES
jgi:hypothetical protein